VTEHKPLNTKALGNFLQGIGRLIAEPDLRAELKERLIETARRSGKAAALEALRQSGADAQTIAAATAELEKAFPEPKR